MTTKIFADNIIEVDDLGIVNYEEAYGKQMEHVWNVMRGGSPRVIFCEHPPVLTLGRMTKKSSFLLSRQEIEKRKIKIVSINRGGDITLHAPGQQVIYPILNLARHGKDLKKYLRSLEDITIVTLNSYGIEAGRSMDYTGVWAGCEKIASIGIGVKKWVSFHGVGINVNTDLSMFSCIKPCGLNVSMTSMSKIKNEWVDINDVKKRWLYHFCKTFGLIESKEAYDEKRSYA